jgi:hypothetical protein
MNTRHRISSWTGAFAAGFLLLFSGAAVAHGPVITGEAVCDESGALIINYFVTSNRTSIAGSHPQVDVLVNGQVVGSGAFVAPENSFSGSTPAPDGTSATLTALTVGPWADGFPGGQSNSVTVVYPPESCETDPGIGRFTGGGHQITIGNVKITRGLTIHCDLLLSNNLEINWPGNKFHMTEHLTTVACTDDPEIIQAPPPAPLDTLIGVGTGKWNNNTGYTVEFTLQDWGEPGGLDRMAILVYETANPANVKLNVPLQILTGGNLQAHYDQPHK